MSDNLPTDRKLVAWTDDEINTLREMAKFYRRDRKREGNIGKDIERPATFQGAILAVVSSEDGIPAATSPTETGRGKIRMRRLWFRGDDVTQQDMDIVGPTEKPRLFNNLSEEFTEHVCYNISETKSWEYGDVVSVLPLKDGYFLAIAAEGGGVQLYHGIIVQVCDENCSTYKVRRVHRYLTADCQDCTTGTGS
jgi:hypothetical protein